MIRQAKENGTLLELATAPQVRPWAGQRLPGGTAGGGVGELWLAWGGARVSGGPWDGQTVEQAVSSSPGLLGRRVAAATGGQFPLLLKILDTGRWMSIQVHPDDDYAAAHHAGQRGKAEAWHVLDAAIDAEVCYGFRHGVDPEILEAAIRVGEVPGLMRHLRLHKGQVVVVPPGTVHSIGPGLLLFEIQTPSDLTFRIHDFSNGRALHPAEALAVADCRATQGPPPPAGLEGQVDDEGALVLLDRPWARLRRRVLDQPSLVSARPDAFALWTSVGGAGAFWRADGFGRTFLLPAGGQVSLPPGTWLESTLPEPEA